MSLEIKNIGPLPDFAAEITGVDLRQDLDDETFGAIERAVFENGVVVLPNQDIDDDQQIAFSERFGALEYSLRFHRHGDPIRPEISQLSNVGDDGLILKADSETMTYHRGNQLWHTDSSFKAVPAKCSILSGREVPPVAGGTEFADVRAAYDGWPGSETLGISKADLEGLVCEHSIIYSRSTIVGDIFTDEQKNAVPAVRQVLVREHSATGRKVLYVGSHCSYVIGWPTEKGRALIKELNDWVVQDKYVFRHTWRQHDLVIWDNRIVLHRGQTWAEEEHRRVMHRTTVAGDGPTTAQVAA